MRDNKFESDLSDSEKDKQKLQPDEVILDLPEIKDIPGQENIHVPDLKEMADTTISSDDEEAFSLLDSENNDDLSIERCGPASKRDEDDLLVDDDELEAQLDEEDNLNEDDDA